jgi:hypothetical protein
MENAQAVVDEIRRKVEQGEYSVRPDAMMHSFKESFSQDAMEEAVLNGRVIEEYPERRRYLFCGFITIGKKTKTALHVVCEYSDPQDVVDFVTAYIPTKERWVDPWMRRR